MSVSQINSAVSLPKNYHIHQNAVPSEEEVAAFEASLGVASEDSSESSSNSSQGQSDAPTMDAVWKGFNQSFFDHDRRDLARWDQMKKDIDYGNKT